MSFHDQNIPAFESRATKRKNRQLIASTAMYARAGKLAWSILIPKSRPNCLIEQQSYCVLKNPQPLDY